MSAHSTLSERRIAIVGLGLMGGSLALALRGKCKALYGYDTNAETVALARRKGLVEQASAEVKETLSAADTVILATPVGAIIDIIEQLPEMHPGSPVVLDLGSTKEHICRKLEALPPRFDPIGGHPMCGKETGGLASAEASIFEGAPFALVPLGRTSSTARRLADELVSAVGSHSIWLDPTTHDRWVAATSHLPYLLSACLALATPPEAAPMVGPGFRGATRLAASSVSMMCDAVSTNRENILQAADSFRAQLDRMETALKDQSPEALADILRSSRISRQQFVPEQTSGELP